VILELLQADRHVEAARETLSMHILVFLGSAYYESLRLIVIWQVKKSNIEKMGVFLGSA
jgi:hypothetical protein